MLRPQPTMSPTRVTEAVQRRFRRVRPTASSPASLSPHRRPGHDPPTPQLAPGRRSRRCRWLRAEVALTAVERLDPPPIPTVIVLDCQMPGLSGLEVAERVPAPNARQIRLFTAFLGADPLAASQRPRHPIRTHHCSRTFRRGRPTRYRLTWERATFGDLLAERRNERCPRKRGNLIRRGCHVTPARRRVVGAGPR
jgi:hypothetical protein